MKEHIAGYLLVGAACAMMSGCAALGIGAAGGAAAGGIESAEVAEEEPGYGPGTYAATVLSNALYFPAKAIFAGAGAATSGVAYLVTLGDSDVSGSIWNASVNGDYLITPEMIAGDEEVEFVG